MSVWEAVIKVDTTSEPARRASDIAEGIGYACALLRDEYGWRPSAITRVLNRVIDDVEDAGDHDAD